MIIQIKNNVSILQVLSYLGLKPNGSNFINSIYKDEKTPSLKIYPETNTFFCFATDQGGDVIKFYSDYNRIDTKQTIKELSEIFSIKKYPYSNDLSVSGEAKSNRQPEQKYFLLQSEKELFDERAAIVEFDGNEDQQTAESLAFNQILENRKEIQSKIYEAVYKFSLSKGFDEAAYKYLTGKNRGLTEKSINDFRLFTINGVKEIIEFLKDNFSRDEIKISGFFKNKYFIFTKHRLIIPYIENGKIVYLRGRYFYKGNIEPENFGKYIGLNNWSLTLSPKRFYNSDLLKELIPYEDLIITEGEFDCIITNQIGYKAVGISGVSNFPEQKIKQVKNYNIHLAFDSDEAGQKAIKKISHLFDKPIKVIKLKVHKDLTELFNAEQ
ncbi:MAG: toprim domain-containing protein [Melioribacteraceae bacterium]|nr:toprim domain-containing protein [Melioribacteraceae bacterium]